MNRYLIAGASILSVGFGSIASANAAMLTNGGFETGDLSGWTIRTTVNGSYGVNPDQSPLPNVTEFDVTGDGVSSLAAQFRVGQVNFTEAQFSGGSLTQSVYLDAGQFQLSADAASQSKWRNASGGLLELMFDGNAIASHDFAAISSNLVEYASLSARFDVLTEGWYDVGFQFTRPYLTTSTTPTQFVDNVTLTTLPQSVPEARGGWVMLLAGLGLGAAVRRQRSL
jgi:MYXO-CTERM domain-containing protein